MFGEVQITELKYIISIVDVADKDRYCHLDKLRIKRFCDVSVPDIKGVSP